MLKEVSQQLVAMLGGLEKKEKDEKAFGR